jgi:hypothetical protein
MLDNYDNFNYNSNNNNIVYSELNLISEKIDTKIKEINYYRQLILNINQIEEFISSKLKFTQFLFSLEEELLDYLRKYKNLFMQNKQLLDKCENFNTKNQNLELKLYSVESLSNEYKNNINELINQINFQKEKIFSKDDYIKNIEEKLQVLERNLNLNSNLNSNYSKRNFISNNNYNYNKDFNYNYNYNYNNSNEALNNIRNDINDYKKYENYEILNDKKFDYGNNYDVKNENENVNNEKNVNKENLRNLMDYNNINNIDNINYHGVKFEGLNYYDYEKYSKNNPSPSTNPNLNPKLNPNDKTNKEFVKGFLKNYEKNPNIKNIEDINITSGNNNEAEKEKEKANLLIKETNNQKGYKFEDNYSNEGEEKKQIQINNNENDNYNKENTKEILRLDMENDLESEKVNNKLY